MNEIMNNDRDIDITALFSILYANKFKLIISITLLPLFLFLLSLDKPNKHQASIAIPVQSFDRSSNILNGSYPNLNHEINFIKDTISGILYAPNIEKTLVDYNIDQSDLNFILPSIKNNIEIFEPNIKIIATRKKMK